MNQIINASLLEELVFLQLLRKLVLKESLNFVMVRLYSSQLIPIRMSKNCLPTTC